MTVLKSIYANSVFYVLFMLFSIVGIPVMTLFVFPCAVVLPYRLRVRLCRLSIFWYGWVILKLARPAVRIEGSNVAQHPCPEGGIVVCNHRSASDAFLMAAVVTLGIRYNVVQVVNTWPMRIPVLGWVARQAGYLSIKEMPVEDFLKRAEAVLADKGSVIAFPEGTRSASKEMGTFHGTVFRLALRTKAPIVPICISGNENIPVKGSLHIEPGTIRMKLLEPLRWETYKDLTSFQLKNKVRTIINDTLTQMDQSCGNHPCHQDKKWLLPVDSDEFLPQFPPMRFIDTLTKLDENTGEAVYTVPEKSPFVDEKGQLDRVVFFEMMAQAAAIYEGVKTNKVGADRIQGFLLGARRFNIYKSAYAGDRLTVTALKTTEFGDFSIIDGAVRRGDETLAEGEIKLFQKRE